MPTCCHPRGSLIDVAVAALIKEIIARFEARRRRRRQRRERCTCSPVRVTSPVTM